MFQKLFHICTAFVSISKVCNGELDKRDLSPLVASLIVDSHSLAPRRIELCLLDSFSCQSNRTRRVPIDKDLLISKDPPKCNNSEYTALAERAEALVPSSWWRLKYANQSFLLYDKSKDLPRPLLRNTMYTKRLKSIAECVGSSEFSQYQFTFAPNLAFNVSSCFEVEPGQNRKKKLQRFHDLWNDFRILLSLASRTSKPKITMDSRLLESASVTLESFLHSKLVGTPRDCMSLKERDGCRAALAAASLVLAIDRLMQLISFTPPSPTLSRKEVEEHIGHLLAEGFVLAGLCRNIIHGDTESSGREESSGWRLRSADCVGVQAALISLYSNSFGQAYSSQLATQTPMVFYSPPAGSPPVFPYKEFAPLLEPIHVPLRNWMFLETGNLIDLSPYQPLVGIPAARAIVEQTLSQAPSSSTLWDGLTGKSKACASNIGGRRILVDVGANWFFSSPKSLLDSYAVQLPFTHALLVEPDPLFSATVPPVYNERYCIHYLPVYSEVGTGGPYDVLSLLLDWTRPDDYVVLKYDVDTNGDPNGKTMEWGFLYSLLQNSSALALVDELYIELHFHSPVLNWGHAHSNWEALDTFRYLRSEGMIIHSWP